MDISRKITISRLRLFLGRSNPGGAPLAVERLLSCADLDPSGMPPQTVLVVRRLEDPQPGGIVGGPRATQVRKEWERRARDRLTELYHHAIRPASQVVPAKAEAVIFSDESELLACLLRDLAYDAVLQRWWWQGVLRSGWGMRIPSSQSEAVEATVYRMEHKAHLVPGVLARLEEWRQAADAILILSAAQAEHLLQAVLQAHRLPRLTEGTAPGPPYLPPWSPRRSASLLGKEHNALLGLCLDLHERPQLVRSATYQNRLQAWWLKADATAVPHPEGWTSPAEIMKLQEATPIAPAAERPELGVDDQPSRPALVIQSETRKLTAPFNPVESSNRQDEHELEIPTIEKPADVVEDRQTGEIAEPFFQDISPHLTEVDAQALAAPAKIEVLQPEPQTETFAWSSGGLPTQLGGVLYLINLMVYLDLPGCFEEGWHLSSCLGPWGLLEVLARALLGEAIHGLEDDPLWLVLAQLDGRKPGDLPGLLMPRSRPRHWPEFQPPVHWLRGLPAEAVQLFRPKRKSKCFQLAGASPWLQRWLDLTLPFIAYRLRLALQLPPEASLAEHLLQVPGRLYLTSSHVDFTASLEDMSLPVRLAGLDRDPGWLPEFGRVVYFHFLE